MAKRKNAAEVINGEGNEKVETGENGAVNNAEVKTRRDNGTGSVYPLNDSKGRYGYCIQLCSDKALRKLYGNKLRSLGVGVDKADAEAKCADALTRRESLLQAKLERLGHFKVEDKTEGEQTPQTEGETV